MKEEKADNGEEVEGIAGPTSTPAVEVSSSNTLFGTMCTALNFRAVNLLCAISVGNKNYM